MNSVPDHSKDTGLALLLIFLLIAYLTGDTTWILPAIVTLVVLMIWPSLFAGPARLWFGFSRLLGTVVSKVLLSGLFYLLVTPVGWIRRLCKHDPMQRKGWKSGRDSSFIIRNHQFGKNDLEKPY
jgi:hypothetical protein